MHGGGWWGFMNASDEKPKVTKELMRRVFRYSLPYKWHLAAMFALILVGTGLSLLSPLIVRELIDNALPARDIQKLILLSIAMLVVPAASGIVGVLQRRFNVRIGEGVIYDLRTALYGRLQRMSLRFFTHTKVGEMMSRLNNDVIGAQNAISNTIVAIITNLINAAAVLSVMMGMEWRLTLISIIILPLFIIAARLLGNRLRITAREQMEANAQMNAMMSETLNIGGALLVKLFGRTDTEIERFSNRAVRVRDLGIRRAMIGAFFFSIIGLVSAVGMALVYGFGGFMVIQGNFTIGTIVAFGSYMGMLYGALQGLSNAPVEFSTSVVSFERVFEVMDLPFDIEEKPQARELKHSVGCVEFENVSFIYDSGNQSALSGVRRYGQMSEVTAVLSGGKTVPEHEEDRSEQSQARDTALESISFISEPGQITALVGPSGAGKTTLTYLIPRLYDPTQGRILLDNNDLRDLTLESLSRQIGMVTQEAYLFHDTIRTNLLYADLNASQRQIEAAAKAANIHDFIKALPDGYDTIVGERGYRLSGGEKQRLALARVILKNPRVLVLDEATSSLDSESEALIQDALVRVMADRTSIVIAHRLSTILAARQILFINRGRITERGTHAELQAINGAYARLYRTQFKTQQVQG